MKFINNSFLEAVLYDWHNNIVLGHQNKDIEFYKEYIIKNRVKTILVVGAGTGRIAIPISKYAYVEALDISLGRLIRLNEHDETINIIACDYLEFMVNKKYDLIIFPYSTLQAFDTTLYEEILLKTKELLSFDGKCLVDYDLSFETTISSAKKLKCSGFCERLKKNIEEYDTIIKFTDYIEVLREFCIDVKNIKIKERWFVFKKKNFDEALSKVNLCITKTFFGYENKKKSHKIVIEIGHNNIDI